MNNVWRKIKSIFTDPDLRWRVGFLLFILAVFRLGATIPVPGVNKIALEKFFEGNGLFGLLDIFSGGGLSTLSIFMLGVGPYITASIVMQLLTMIFPKLKEMYNESGGDGRRKFAQYSRILGVPLAFFQGFSYLTLLTKSGVLTETGFVAKMATVMTITAGSVLLMWLGELISEYGIGNGVSLIIFAGIVARIPIVAGQVLAGFNASQIPVIVAFLVTSILIVAGVVVISEAERPIPITYAKRIRGMKVYGGTSTYLPLRVNQAGVIPIIFALSILLFPQMIVKFLSAVSNPTIASIAQTVGDILSNQIVYGALYFLLVVVFTYFYTAVTFDPQSVSENLQKSGAFIPGIRPGSPTAEYINRILTRLTLVGSTFLGFIAILPLVLAYLMGNSALTIGGTALLIVVSVVLDLVRQVDAQLAMREY